MFLVFRKTYQKKTLLTEMKANTTKRAVGNMRNEQC